MNWNTHITIEDNGHFLETADFADRLTPQEVAAWVEQYYGYEDPEEESGVDVFVTQEVSYICPSSGLEIEMTSDDGVIPLSAVYAHLEAEGFSFSEDQDAWVFGDSEAA